MTDVPPKKESSILALKNSAKHLNELYKEIDNANEAIIRVKSILEQIQGKLGEIYVPVYDTQASKYIPRLLSSVTSDLIKTLNAGKINA